jgi:hypothetical protein
MKLFRIVIIASFLFCFGCGRSPIEGKWQFVGVSDKGKMVSDFNKILFSISPKTRIFMEETEIIGKFDSMNIPADASLLIQFLSKFPGNRKFTGDLGCRNKFKIRYLSGGGKIFFKEIAMTRLPCSANENFLFMYREYLFSSNEYRVSQDTLYLRNLYYNELRFIKIGNSSNI